jgi:hypothetical protein
VIGLKHALELVNPLHTVLSAGVESKLLTDIRQMLQDDSYQIMLEKVQTIIHDEARAQKVTTITELCAGNFLLTERFRPKTTRNFYLNIIPKVSK